MGWLGLALDCDDRRFQYCSQHILLPPTPIQPNFVHRKHANVSLGVRSGLVTVAVAVRVDEGGMPMTVKIEVLRYAVFWLKLFLYDEAAVTPQNGRDLRYSCCARVLFCVSYLEHGFLSSDCAFGLLRIGVCLGGAYY